MYFRAGEHEILACRQTAGGCLPYLFLLSVSELSGPPRIPPPLERHAGPDRFHDGKGKSIGKQAVQGGTEAGKRKDQNPDPPPALQRIGDQHKRNGRKAEESKRIHLYLAPARQALDLPEIC